MLKICDPLDASDVGFSHFPIANKAIESTLLLPLLFLVLYPLQFMIKNTTIYLQDGIYIFV